MHCYVFSAIHIGPLHSALGWKIDTEEIVGRHWHRLAGKRGKGLVGLSQKSTNKRACANNPEYSKCTQYSFNHVPCFVTYLFVFQYIPFLVKLREWRTGRKCRVRTPEHEKCAWGQTRKLYNFEWYNFLIMYLIILIHLTQCRKTSYLARFEFPGWEVWMVWRVAEPLSLKAEARILSIGPRIGRCR